MWTAKFKIAGNGQGLIGARTKNHNVSLAGYPILVKKEKTHILIDFVASIFGKEADKKNFIRDLKQAQEIVNLDSNGDFIVAQARDLKELENAYPESIMNLEPVVIDSKGDNFYTVGSWNRKELNKFLTFVSKKYNAEILKIENRRLTNFYLAKLRPELTDKQKNAMSLAIKQGYYNYPRKTSVEKLAKLSKVSFSAFHAHLRKAEQKLLPYSLEE
jgi:predicted DNA binding protein